MAREEHQIAFQTSSAFVVSSESSSVVGTDLGAQSSQTFSSSDLVEKQTLVAGMKIPGPKAYTLKKIPKKGEKCPPLSQQLEWDYSAYSCQLE